MKRNIASAKTSVGAAERLAKVKIAIAELTGAICPQAQGGTNRNRRTMKPGRMGARKRIGARSGRLDFRDQAVRTSDCARVRLGVSNSNLGASTHRSVTQSETRKRSRKPPVQRLYADRNPHKLGRGDRPNARSGHGPAMRARGWLRGGLTGFVMLCQDGLILKRSDLISLNCLEQVAAFVMPLAVAALNDGTLAHSRAALDDYQTTIEEKR